MHPGLHPKGSGEPLESVKQGSDLVGSVFWVAILAAVGACVEAGSFALAGGGEAGGWRGGWREEAVSEDSRM